MKHLTQAQHSIRVRSLWGRCVESHQGLQMSGYSPHPALMNRGQTAPQHDRNSHLICFASLKQCCKHFLNWFLPFFYMLGWAGAALYLILGRRTPLVSLLWKIALIYTVSLAEMKMCKMCRPNHWLRYFLQLLKIKKRQDSFYFVLEWKAKAHMKDVSIVVYKCFHLCMATWRTATLLKVPVWWKMVINQDFCR